MAALVADPAARVLEAPLLSARECRQLLADSSSPTVASGLAATPAAQQETHAAMPQLLHDGCERKAALAPSARAVELGEERLTYAELEAQANRLARRLMRLGAAPEVPVALGLPPSPAMVAALLGVLKSGAAVVPLDPGLPAARRDFMLRDSGARLLIVEEAPLAPVEGNLEIVEVGRNLAALAGESGATGRPAGLAPANLAYLLYTSGSTGEPKGVAGQHGSAPRPMAAIRELLGLRDADRVLQFAAPGFDVALEQLLPPLTCGATVVMRGGELWSPARLFARLAGLGVTEADLPTAYWQQVGRESATARESAATAPSATV